MNIDPRMAKDPKEWVEYSTGPLTKLVGPVPPLQDNLKWVDWAYGLIQFPQVQTFFPPDPRYFSDWREWVDRFNQAVPL